MHSEKHNVTIFTEKNTNSPNLKAYASIAAVFIIFSFKVKFYGFSIFSLILAFFILILLLSLCSRDIRIGTDSIKVETDRINLTKKQPILFHEIEIFRITKNGVMIKIKNIPERLFFIPVMSNKDLFIDFKNDFKESISIWQEQRIIHQTPPDFSYPKEKNNLVIYRKKDLGRSNLKIHISIAATPIIFFITTTLYGFSIILLIAAIFILIILTLCIKPNLEEIAELAEVESDCITFKKRMPIYFHEIENFYILGGMILLKIKNKQEAFLLSTLDSEKDLFEKFKVEFKESISIWQEQRFSYKIEIESNNSQEKQPSLKSKTKINEEIKISEQNFYQAPYQKSRKYQLLGCLIIIGTLWLHSTNPLENGILKTTLITISLYLIFTKRQK